MVIDQCNAYRHGGNPLYLGPEIFLSVKGLLGTSIFVLGWKTDFIRICRLRNLAAAEARKTPGKRRLSFFMKKSARFGTGILTRERSASCTEKRDRRHRVESVPAPLVGTKPTAKFTERATLQHESRFVRHLDRDVLRCRSAPHSLRSRGELRKAPFVAPSHYWMMTAMPDRISSPADRCEKHLEGDGA